MRKIGKMNNPQLREHELNVLVDILTSTKSKAELKSVLMTILTRSERDAISQRITIICRVRKGKKYFEIEGALGVASATIAKSIDIFLKNGEDNKNFDNVINRYEEPEFKYQIKPKYPDKKASREIFGIRSLQREDQRMKKKWAKKKLADSVDKT